MKYSTMNNNDVKYELGELLYQERWMAFLSDSSNRQQIFWKVNVNIPKSNFIH